MTTFEILLVFILAIWSLISMYQGFKCIDIYKSMKDEAKLARFWYTKIKQKNNEDN